MGMSGKLHATDGLPPTKKHMSRPAILITPSDNLILIKV